MTEQRLKLGHVTEELLRANNYCPKIQFGSPSRHWVLPCQMPVMLVLERDFLAQAQLLEYTSIKPREKNIADTHVCLKKKTIRILACVSDDNLQN